MIKKISILSIIVLASMISCMQNTKENTSSNTLAQGGNELVIEGEKLFRSQCISCHNPDAKEGSRLAPPPFAIKKHYKKDHPELADFTKAMLDFLQEPTKEKAKLTHAVEKFNLMPKMNYKKEDLEKIAAYLYETKFEKGKGKHKHKQHYKGKNESGSEQQFLEKGKDLALSTKKVLGKNLIGAINNKGTEGALEFCSSKAIHLTDSMANELKAKIKRVSDKNRNPNNMASSKEMAYIQEGKEKLQNGEGLQPHIFKERGKFVGYYPILTNQMCLQCHGKPNEDISENTLSKIASLYPEDKAVNYGLNELRGIWVVEMEADSTLN